ncbi:MAG: hypothetical protein J5872_03715 [Lachnospiraceae bacterium]|nr:hypothetical protein [Lachnospiraceae bacterium]
MKKLLAILLVFVLAFCLTACDDDDDDKGSSKKSRKIEQTKKITNEEWDERAENTYRGSDEDYAEEVRHCAEIATAEIEVYDEIVAIIRDKEEGAEIIRFSENGIEMLYDTPYLKRVMDDVYGADYKCKFKSKKYAGKEYIVTFKLLPGAYQGAALTVTGSWR